MLRINTAKQMWMTLANKVVDLHEILRDRLEIAHQEAEMEFAAMFDDFHHGENLVGKKPPPEDVPPKDIPPKEEEPKSPDKAEELPVSEEPEKEEVLEPPPAPPCALGLLLTRYCSDLWLLYRWYR